ncbi:helix-turn-helix domain-containing protein [Hymenobacter sp. YC55]|uniref:winged helix-turn-helix transcriptional regulator n=1 Tax=Hymenobacter sp. YC55 TaxID=3034019 RepID=UPI0023F87AB5|nr:helix-turn-helix domain-containing protein [Hymenobacter sp. YC55]MDF7813883.1 helix-turn-helix domain-containing protein [Hymenobacter sp. YC55]
MRDATFCSSSCNVTRTMGVLGGKWKLIIISYLRQRRRFGQLVQRSALISRKVLTEQLRELEEDGIVRREAFAELPPRVEYSLTEYGQALLPIIDQLVAWHNASPVIVAAPTGEMPPPSV